MRRGNKGFTLIELMVTIAIMAIFSGVVLTTVGTGANSYRKTSSNAKAQMETQEVMDQIQNMIIDVNRSVYYAYGKGINENIGDEIRNDIDYGSESSSRTFFACSASEKNAAINEFSYSCDVVEWDSDSQKLYYACRVWDGVETEKTDNKDNTQSVSALSDDGENPETGNDFETGNTVTSKRTSEVSTKVEKTLLAENITDFRVDVSKAASDRIVRFQFTTNKNGKEITTLHTVNLRNQVQIQKPEEGYGTSSDGQKAGIVITYYPLEIKAGETLSGFERKLIGNIDPDTVQWIVESGDGQFKGSDGNNLSLEAGKDASGTIKVHVEAKTTDGKTVASSSVTINVIVRIANELVTDTTKLVLAVGGSYTLADTVKWRIEYDDGSKSEENVGGTALTYEAEANSEIIAAGITLTTDGSLQIPNTLGTDKSNAEFIFTVKYYDRQTEKYISGTFLLELARLDISKPSGTLEVGKIMPFEYTYKEGGTIVNVDPKVFYTEKPRKTATGAINNVLNEGDTGNWSIRAEVKVSDRTETGYGTARAETTFTVIPEVETTEIKINNESGKTIVAAGQEYYCSRYNKEDIYILIPPEYWSSQYKLTWKIEHKSDKNTFFKNGRDTIVGSADPSINDGDDVILNIGKQEKELVLSAYIEIYDNVNPKILLKNYYASINLKTLTNVEIINTFENSNDKEAETFEVIKGKTYELKFVACVWSYGKSEYEALDIEMSGVWWNKGNQKNSWKVEDWEVNGDLTISIAGGLSNVYKLPWNYLKASKPYVLIAGTTK